MQAGERLSFLSCTGHQWRLCDCCLVRQQQQSDVFRGPNALVSAKFAITNRGNRGTWSLFPSRSKGGLVHVEAAPRLTSCVIEARVQRAELSRLEAYIPSRI